MQYLCIAMGKLMVMAYKLWLHGAYMLFSSLVTSTNRPVKTACIMSSETPKIVVTVGKKKTLIAGL